jgi:hypothetical protein
MKLTHPARGERKRDAERPADRDRDGEVMNSIATTTRQITRTTAAGTRGGSLRAATRRLAGWWNDDLVSARFSAARAHDERLLRRR